MTTRFLTSRLLVATIVIAAASAVAYGCASAPAVSNETTLSARATAMLKSSFKAHGQAGLDRLDQDDTQRVCSRYADGKLPETLAQKVEAENLAAIRYPADGNLVGDWKAGEKIAQTGRGLQFSDDAKKPNGANCYACHQLAPQELSYGTMGPSLYQFGKRHGYTEQTRRYAWAKIYDAEAYSACTSMPRFGQHGILTEQQIRDVVALLVDPASPVNQ